MISGAVTTPSAVSRELPPHGSAVKPSSHRRLTRGDSIAEGRPCGLSTPELPGPGLATERPGGSVVSMERQSVLFRSENRAVWLVDLPASIEEGQEPRETGPPTRRLVSEAAPEQPFALPEPKGPPPQTPAAQVRELMTQAAVLSALEELQQSHGGPWCLPRILGRRGGGAQAAAAGPETTTSRGGQASGDFFHRPAGSRHLSGTIQDMREELLASAPPFDLIVLDPPWPNRSARRKKDSYRTAPDMQSVRQLLSLVPVAPKLKPGGLVAVWVTNKPAITELLTAPRGVFSEWGVELVDTWTWLKITAAGEPMFSLDSLWRKPWEQLLVAAKIGSRQRWPRDGRVIVGVPDAHSRKPHLRRTRCICPTDILTRTSIQEGVRRRCGIDWTLFSRVGFNPSIARTDSRRFKKKNFDLPVKET